MSISRPLSEVAATRVCDSRIESGVEFSCCQSGGELVCWGLEEFRGRWELAHSNTSIAAGDRHFCYVDTEGDVYCGGDCSEADCGRDSGSSWLDEPTRLGVPSPGREVLISGETWVVLRSGERLSWERGEWEER
ncbi:MAG: RCC1 domain-containing protein [Polyangiales bacterium]